MMLFDDRLAAYRQLIERYLQDQFLKHQSEPQQELFDAMQYSLLAGGKRLRAALVLEFCRISGGNYEKALPFAAAIEMIHAYSLIHDDLPCMDDDDFRRGKPTNHKVFGEAMAILAGDGLLTDAFRVASVADLPAPDVLTVIQILSECAGSLGMVGGQVLDIRSEQRILNEQEVLDIQSRKTGALIRAACAIGAVAGGSTEAQFDAACQYAAGLGLAFQIRDDMLDVIGSAEELGKSVGTDLGKNTFVRLYGLDRCEALVTKYTQYALSALQPFEDTAFLRQLAITLTSRMT